MTFAQLSEWSQLVGGLMACGLFGTMFVGALWVGIRRGLSQPAAPAGPRPADATPVRNYADVKHEHHERGDEDPLIYRAKTIEEEDELIRQMESQLEIARFDPARRVGLPYKTSDDALTEPPPPIARPQRAWIKHERGGLLLGDAASERLLRDGLGTEPADSCTTTVAELRP